MQKYQILTTLVLVGAYQHWTKSGLKELRKWKRISSNFHCMQNTLDSGWVTLATPQFWNFGPNFWDLPEVSPK